MSSENHLDMIAWNSTHFNGTYKYKDQYKEIITNETKTEFYNSLKKISLSTVRDVIENWISFIEYCHNYGGTVNDLLHMGSIIRDEYPEFYSEFMKLNCKPSEQFITYIKWVVMDIKAKGQDFDIFDYSYFTKLRPISFKMLCQEILKGRDYDIVRSVVNKFENYMFIEIDKEQELKGVTIIKGYEVTREEKEFVFAFLEENNIPYYAYKCALRKYIAGDERIVDSKSSTRQKRRDR